MDSSSFFLVVSLGFSLYSITSSAVTVLLIPFQFGFPLFLFLVWLLWLGLPILCWIKVVRVGILVVFLILEEMLSAFHCWVWRWLWAYHIWPLFCSVLSIPTFWKVFIINGCWILSKAFSASIEMTVMFFSKNKFIYLFLAVLGLLLHVGFL